MFFSETTISKSWSFNCLSSTQKWVKKVQIGISCTHIDRKMKIKRKRYFQVNYSFMKVFSQKVLTQCGDVINLILAWKRAQTCVSCTKGVRKMKIKAKRDFELKYLFMKLLSQNFEILAACLDVITAELWQKDSNCVSCWYKFRFF